MRSSWETVETKSDFICFDEPVGGDVAEREDPARDGTSGIAHHRLGDGEEDLLAAAHDRDQAIALRRIRLGLERALEHLGRRTAERVGPRHARDPLGGGVPQHDVAVAVDGDDPVGDVREDREAPFLLERGTRTSTVRPRGIRT